MGSGFSTTPLLTVTAFLLFAKTQMASGSYTGAVLFFHGLGDSGDGWRFLRRQYSDLDHVKFSFPTAPEQPVTCNMGYPSTSWFDIDRIPVTPSEPENPAGLVDSIAQVHGLIDKLEEEGIPAERVVLAGFSQGAVLSLQAGLTYPKKLAGIAALSGWLARKSDIAGLVTDSNKSTPILICHGTQDDKVLFELGQDAVSKLEEVGHSVTFNEYRMGHSSCPEELDHLKGFLESVLPRAAN
ncbi:unnamed protein product [Heterosigma akashiwo]